MLLFRKVLFCVGRKWWRWRYGWRLIAVRLESQYVHCFFLVKKHSCIQCMQCGNVLNLFHVNRKTLEWSFRLYFRVSKAGSITLKCFYYLECIMFSPTGYLFRPWISVAELNYVFSGHIQIAATQFKYGTLST